MLKHYLVVMTQVVGGRRRSRPPKESSPHDMGHASSLHSITASCPNATAYRETKKVRTALATVSRIAHIYIVYISRAYKIKSQLGVASKIIKEYPVNYTVNLPVDFLFIAQLYANFKLCLQ